MSKEVQEPKMATATKSASLEEVNGSVEVPKSAGFLRTLWAFSGPGALVAVGYMDPGNWITSIVGGAQYRYLLLSVVIFSGLIAMLMQYMAAKLGVVTRMDLAQAIRDHTNKPVGFLLWIMTELAIMATDIAEVIGGAIALQLLFGIPLTMGVMITILDVFLLLLLTKLGFRTIEAIVATLIASILIIFLYLVALSKPSLAGIMGGILPRASIVMNHDQLTLALGIVGATVMPHNLYLHSSIAQTRQYDSSDEEEVAKVVRFTTWDSNIQLFGATIVNSLLLLLGAALFFGHADQLQAFGDLYRALSDNTIAKGIASPVLSTLFAVALLASGQNATITGTLTGQIIMEGFIHLKMPLWARRLVTRIIAVIPVMVAAIIWGGTEGVLDNLLVYSQVFLSVALPFTMIPLIWFTSSKKYMGERFVNPLWVSIIGWAAAIGLTILNIQLVFNLVIQFFEEIL
ncbi:Nramp family divalent metal transporter [Dellaglioa algida]|uniref:Nramp family divalent metal transporter n=1 Tax=Dellaglioa algida TaxID=105612 RepID=UPI0024C4A006|nr:Nramp family divalent metal transporter [Dellaglioa algida]MDK1716028.1 Nramp family divalent metal transporter [Dellaglioa algida]MDK1721189.1 Nramp family divalent metal transporter [Dellaglioa algida]MDK1724271.1 Nramp family divalent metal transporter [Dellaglioa algida]MDK1738290.1 Nramp family divalent metal transporter [Dellaglioa algida]